MFGLVSRTREKAVLVLCNMSKKDFIAEFLRARKEDGIYMSNTTVETNINYYPRLGDVFTFEEAVAYADSLGFEVRVLPYLAVIPKRRTNEKKINVVQEVPENINNFRWGDFQAPPPQEDVRHIFAEENLQNAWEFIRDDARRIFNEELNVAPDDAD